MTVAIVLGGAECLWADLAAARELHLGKDIYVAVNHAGIVWPGPLHFWVSYHPELLYLKWRLERERNGFTAAGSLVSTSTRPDIYKYPKVDKVKISGGSSGMLAAFVAMDHADKVILCGVPMDPVMPHWHKHSNRKPWVEAKKYHRHWVANLDKLRDKVRSMSGWTRDLLGAPTREWLDERSCLDHPVE